MKPDWLGLGRQKECELQSPGRKFRLILSCHEVSFTILISLAARSGSDGNATINLANPTLHHVVVLRQQFAVPVVGESTPCSHRYNFSSQSLDPPPKFGAFPARQELHDVRPHRLSRLVILTVLGLPCHKHYNSFKNSTVMIEPQCEGDQTR